MLISPSAPRPMHMYDHGDARGRESGPARVASGACVGALPPPPSPLLRFKNTT